MDTGTPTEWAAVGLMLPVFGYFVGWVVAQVLNFIEDSFSERG
jgi:hypothetical protein